MNTPTSPKVIAVAIVGILLTSVLSNIGTITPSLFAFLGPWEPFVYGVVITAVSATAGYLINDPLRTPPTPAPVPAPQPGTAPATEPLAPQPIPPTNVQGITSTTTLP